MPARRYARSVDAVSRHALPAADAAWLHMDSPTNPMVVNALVLLGEPLDADLTADVFQRLVVDRFPRFSQRIVQPLGRAPAFEDDPTFDLHDHLHRLALPAPGDQRALQALVSDLITAPLDPNRPLWHAHLIEGYGEGGAVLVRIHHCIADGIALARLLISITDEADAHGPLGTPPHHGLVNRTLRAAGTVAGAAVHEGIETAAHPGHVAELASTALRDTATLAKLLGSPADEQTVLKSGLTGTREVAWTEPFPLARVKAAGRRAESTINDLLIAALTGALRDYLADEGELPDEIHAMVPFNLRALDQPVSPELGNDFALILLSLPVGIADHGERLREVHRRMDEIKHSHEAPISFGILSAMGMTPPLVEGRLIDFFTDKASMVVTNVPGPREPVTFAGSPVTGVLVWAPCSGRIGMTVSIFSYAGDVTVGFMTDVALVPEPDLLARGFDRELRRLCAQE